MYGKIGYGYSIKDCGNLTVLFSNMQIMLNQWFHVLLPSE